MSESQKKTPRTFQCRDALWEKFEEMARELECSVDYLVNDAMKQYARQRGYAAAAPTTGAPPSSLSQAAPPAAVPASAAPPAAASSPRAGSPKPAPLPPVSAALPPLPSRTPGRSPLPSLSGELPKAPPPAPLAPPPIAPAPPPLAMPTAPPVPTSTSRVPPPPPGPKTAAAPPPPRPQRTIAGPALTVYYQGTAYPVTKENFIIGRGKQVSDLTIRDPNISRQHAAIEFSGGAFWMVDMQSTNGVEFNGQRVNRRQIKNGEVYRICSHELLMSLT